jgi:large subunit ribosomal protein L6
MGHKGNKLIPIPTNVEVVINNNNVLVKGTLGQLVVSYPPQLVKVENNNNYIKVSRLNDQKQAKVFHGTVNANIANAIIGVSTGFKKILKIVGVGYKAAIANGKLVLSIGFSHPVEFAIPTDLKVVCPSLTQIEISGFNKISVGEFSANIRAVRPPEPYKGKGIMYIDEHIIRKEGKTAESATSTGAKKK